MSYVAIARTIPSSSTPLNLRQTHLVWTSKAASSTYGNCVQTRSPTPAKKDVISNGAVLWDVNVPITEARVLLTAGESRFLLLLLN